MQSLNIISILLLYYPITIAHVYMESIGSTAVPVDTIHTQYTPWVHVYDLAIPCFDPSSTDAIDEAFAALNETIDNIFNTWDEALKHSRVIGSANTSIPAYQTMMSSLKSTLGILADKRYLLVKQLSTLINTDVYLGGLITNPICIPAGESYSVLRSKRDTHVHVMPGSKVSVDVAAYHGAQIHSTTSTTASPYKYTDVSQQSREDQPSYPHLLEMRRQALSAKPQSPHVKSSTRELTDLHEGPTNNLNQQPYPKKSMSSLFLADEAPRNPTQLTATLKVYECLYIADIEFRCEHVSSKVLDGQSLRSMLAPRRQKRAVLGFIGEIQKWLYGTMDNKDRETIINLMKNLEAQINSTKRYVLSKDGAMVSLARDVKTEIINVKSTVDKKLNQIATNIDTIAKVHDATVAQMIDTNTKLDMVQQVELITLHIMSILDGLQQSIHNIGIFRTFLLGLRNSVITNTISSELVTADMISHTLQIIKRNLPPQYMLPNLTNMVDWYSKDVATISIHNNKLLYSVMLPVITKESQVETYHIRSLPFQVEGQWFMYPFNNYVIQHRHTTASWYLMTYDEFLQCRASPFHMCPLSLSRYNQDPTNCLGNLLSQSAAFPEGCHIRLNRDYAPLFPTAIRIKKGTWMVVGPEDSNVANIKCHTGNDLVDQKTQVFKHQSLIILADSCTATIGPLVLDNTGLLNLQSSTSYYIPRLYGSSKPLNQSYMLERGTTQIQKLFQNLTLKPVIDKSKIMFPSSTINVKSLERKLASGRAEYLDEMDALSSEFHSFLSNLTTETDDWTSFLIPKFDIINTVCLMMASTSLLLVLYIYCRGARMPIKTAAAMQLVPGAWSKVVGYYIPPVNITTTVLPTLNRSQSDIVERGDHSTHVPHFVGIVVMVLIMSLCHYMMKRKLTCFLQRLYATMGVLWKNSRAIHNPGESCVEGYFLVRVTTRFPSWHFVCELPIQLCTIPMNPDDWTLRSPPNISKWIGEGRLKKDSDTHFFVLDWSPTSVCIMNTKSADIETCGDMPRHVQFPSWYYHQFIKYPWYSVGINAHVKGITKLVIRQGSIAKTIYQYHD